MFLGFEREMMGHTDAIFKDTKDPRIDLIGTWQILGSIDEIQEKLKSERFDGSTLVASRSLHQNGQGKDIGCIAVHVIFGDNLKQEDYIKINSYRPVPGQHKGKNGLRRMGILMLRPDYRCHQVLYGGSIQQCLQTWESN